MEARRTAALLPLAVAAALVLVAGARLRPGAEVFEITRECRRAKQTQAFMKAGYLDPKNLLFVRGRVVRVCEVAEQSLEELIRCIAPLPQMVTHDAALGAAARAFGFDVRGT